MAFTVVDFPEFIRLVSENPQWRAELRRLVLPDEFAELPALVRRMAEWQQAMAEEQRALAEGQRLLFEAQDRADKRFEELAEGQRLLFEAQARTDKRFEELTAEVRTLTAEVRALAEGQRLLFEAQARTERQLAELTAEHAKTRKLLGDLSSTVGYTLENEAYKALPALLARDYGLIVEGRLKRGYLTARDGRHLEINILGRGRRNGEVVIILGESKAQLSKNNIDRFLNRKLKLLPDLGAPVFVIFVAHMISEADAEDYARERGAVVYYSYDF
jgi:cold shock CspA family protein